MNKSQKKLLTNISLDSAITSKYRMRFGLGLTLLGLLIFIIGARPSLFYLDRSPVVGFAQISVFLVGLAFISLGGFISLMVYWGNGNRTIVADIGTRLVATGYVIAVFAGMADIFGFGTQPFPRIPFFGPWQSTGVKIGQSMIAGGLLLMVRYRRMHIVNNK